MVLALLVACSRGGGGTAVPSVPSGWTTFTDRNGRFALAHPADWQVRSLTGYRTSIDPADPNQETQEITEDVLVPPGQPDIGDLSKDPTAPHAWFVEVYVDRFSDPADLRSSMQANASRGWGPFSDTPETRSGHTGGVLRQTLAAKAPPSYSGPEWCGGCVEVDYYFTWGSDGFLLLRWNGAPADFQRWEATAKQIADTLRDPRVK
jgi:hypothetical protein